MNEPGPLSPPEPPAPPPPPGRAWRRAAGPPVLALLLAASGAALFLRRDFDRPAGPARGSPLIVQVQAGTGVRAISQALAERGLIRHPLAFQLQARLRGGARRIRAGYYEFSPSMPPRAIYRALTEGRVAQRTFTIPEGYNLREITLAIERSGLAPRGAILDAARDPELLSRAGAEGGSLEGYLFPDTYRFPLGTPPREILSAMAQNLRRKFSPALRERAEKLGLSLHEALTLASLIEKETPMGAERPLVSAVFWNRLKKDMPLQSDPTVSFALPGLEGPLRRQDLSADSPYNTYLHKGLPPGPLASPGRPA
ncbi:MAG: endolytic transglycosylase MltG, partial [Nitrospinota bacterium]